MTSDIASTTGSTARLVIVGGGPRAVGILDRLAANAELLDGARLVIDVIDPHMPGAGRVWSLEQSPLLLMNSRARDVTIHADDSVRMAGPHSAGPSLARWAEGIRSGEIPAPTAGRDLLAEIEQLTASSFASRRLQGLYLEWFLGQVLRALPSTVEVRLHRSTVTALRRGVGTGAEHWSLDLDDGRELGAELVVLCLGHTDARPTPEQHALAAFARRHGGSYIPPGHARGAELSSLGAGEDVVVRGMGLAFVDLLAQLTEGRGGRFVPEPRTGEVGALRYEASGEEPRLWVGSRRGVPYHAKIVDEEVPAGPRALVHLTADALAEREDPEGKLGFAADVLPLIAADVAHAIPDAPSPDEDPRLSWLDDPLAWLRGAVADSPERAVTDAVVRHVEHDLRSHTGADTEHERALFQVLLRVTGALVELVPAGRLREEPGQPTPRWWHSLFSFVDSGPPPHRLHQLLALERAGILRFLGPGLTVRADETSGRFLATGVAGTRVRAGALLEAFLPEPTLVDSTDALLRALVVGGGAAIGRESPVAPGRLEIDADQRVLDPEGEPHPTLWAAGPWTSELPTGAFARPATNAPVFRRNDALARAVLRAAAGRTGAATGTTHATGGVAEPTRARRVRLGILGPGRIGSAVARLAVRRGLDVRVAGRQGPAAVTGRIPGACGSALEEIGPECDVVVLAVPLSVALTIDPAALAGCVVIDATNAWGEAETALLPGAAGSSEAVAAHLSTSRVVKTLNHIGYHDVEEHAHRVGAGRRRALALAGDDDGALAAVSHVLSLMGFDPVVLGSLVEGRDLEPGGPLFTGWSTRQELEAQQARLRVTAA